MNFLEQMNDVIFQCITSFLTTQEYVKSLLLSKTIRQKLLKYKKLRMPVVFILGWCYSSNRFYKLTSKYHYSEEGIEILKKLDVNIFDKEYVECNQDIIFTMLKFGPLEITNADITLFPVPYKFRKCIKHHKLSRKKYLQEKFEKFKKENNNTIEMQSMLFEKLMRRYEFFNQYDLYDDVYMKSFKHELYEKLLRCKK